MLRTIYPRFAETCQGCEARPTCPVRVNPADCPELDAGDRAYHEGVDDEAQRQAADLAGNLEGEWAREGET